MTAQHELPLTAALAHAVFPGRTLLIIAEVAEALKCTQQHVLDLVEEGQLVAVDIRGKLAGATAKPSDMGNKSARRCLRIPVSAYDTFIKARAI